MAAFVTDWSSADIIAEYRDLCARSDAVLAVTSMSARPRGKHGDPEVAVPRAVRWVVLHVIEETARSAVSASSRSLRPSGHSVARKITKARSCSGEKALRGTLSSTRGDRE
jgi:hypothetical protein